MSDPLPEPEPLTDEEYIKRVQLFLFQQFINTVRRDNGKDVRYILSSLGIIVCFIFFSIMHYVNKYKFVTKTNLDSGAIEIITEKIGGIKALSAMSFTCLLFSLLLCVVLIITTTIESEFLYQPEPKVVIDSGPITFEPPATSENEPTEPVKVEFKLTDDNRYLLRIIYRAIAILNLICLLLLGPIYFKIDTKFDFFATHFNTHFLIILYFFALVSLITLCFMFSEHVEINYVTYLDNANSEIELKPLPRNITIQEELINAKSEEKVENVQINVKTGDYYYNQVYTVEKNRIQQEGTRFTFGVSFVTAVIFIALLIFSVYKYKATNFENSLYFSIMLFCLVCFFINLLLIGQLVQTLKDVRENLITKYIQTGLGMIACVLCMSFLGLYSNPYYIFIKPEPLSRDTYMMIFVFLIGAILSIWSVLYTWLSKVKTYNDFVDEGLKRVQEKEEIEIDEDSNF
jgi:hypothetical protein